MMQDLEAARVLFSSGAKLLYIPCGNNVMFQTKYHSARALRGQGPLGDYLNLLMMVNRWPMEEPFNLADLAAVGVLAHPEMVSWLESAAPWLDESGDFDFSRTFGNIKVATGLAENVYGAPVPLWSEFLRQGGRGGPRWRIAKPAREAAEHARGTLCRTQYPSR